MTRTNFENLIKYLPLLEDDNIGTWIIDRENDGTLKSFANGRKLVPQTQGAYKKEEALAFID